MTAPWTSDVATLLHQTDAVGLAEHVKRGDVSPRELLEAAIERVGATNAEFNYIAQHCEDRAFALADGPMPESPLAGVPFLVKDLGIDIAGVRTGSGSLFLNHIAETNSNFVDRADAAGLLIFAKTTTPELGLTVTTESKATGRTRNPWNTERTTGGSSGGAACAVAAGAVPMAQASDGGGSVRVPASCCGLLGLKTSRGRIPLGPGKVEDWNGLSGIGPISRSVRDAAAFLDLFGVPAAGDRVRPARPASYLAAHAVAPRRLRIALMIEPLTAEPGGGAPGAQLQPAGVIRGPALGPGERLGARLHEGRRAAADHPRHLGLREGAQGQGPGRDAEALAGGQEAEERRPLDHREVAELPAAEAGADAEARIAGVVLEGREGDALRLEPGRIVGQGARLEPHILAHPADEALPAHVPGSVSAADDEHEPALLEHSGEQAELGHGDVVLALRSQMG